MLFRKAILLIHGFAGGNWDYGSLGNELQLYIDFDVFTFTLPGHEKMVIGKISKDDWIRAAEEQMEILISRGYKKIYVVGHSMGGVIACHIARKYPQVKKLVLAAPAFRYLKFKDEKFDLIGSLKKAPELIKDYTAEVVISRAMKMSVTASRQFMALVKEHHDDPKYITCPTLIIHGLDDVLVPVESATYVHDSIQSDINILIKMRDVTHDVFMSTRKEETYKLVKEFFRKKYLPTKKTETI